MDSGIPANARFFIAKAINFDSLRNCHHSSIWACRGRKLPPQPGDLLTEALRVGPVILIYSVNNCHGWHGYAQMLTKPGAVNSDGEGNQSNDAGEDTGLSGENSSVGHEDEWMRFKVQWIKCYLDENGERCLPSERTANLMLRDKTPVNKARNFQELDSISGYKLCVFRGGARRGGLGGAWRPGAPLTCGLGGAQGPILGGLGGAQAPQAPPCHRPCVLMNEHLDELRELKRQKAEAEEARRPAPFFTADETKEDPRVIWKRLVGKVEKMGQVLLACAFGSQRYNLHTPKSDTDMFIVYAAETKDMLGFTPPQATIKNRDIDACDYTVHEVHRFLELVLAGDPRCVESLFLHPSSIYYSHPDWEELLSHRKAVLTRECCEKYMRDAEGGKGLRLMEKWSKSGEATKDPMPEKVAKLFYIIIRLLQNANEIAAGEELKVYREEGSPERELLLKVRASQCDYEQLMTEIKRLQESIKCHQDNIAPMSPVVLEKIESWLLGLRYNSLKNYYTSKQNKLTGTS